MKSPSEGTKTGPFRLSTALDGRQRSHVKSLFRTALMKALSIDRLERLYAEMPRTHGQSEFLEAALDVLGVTYEVTQDELNRIPKSGPVVIVANHPFGGPEGPVFAAVLRTLRLDVKIMANHMLRGIPEVRELFVPVDPFSRRDSAKHNIRPPITAIQWLQDGGLLMAFPAGEVSHLQLRRREVLDPAWSPHIARIARRTQSPMVPVYFHGANSALFQILGLVHPRLRTALLPRELANKSNSRLEIRIGEPIPHEKLRRFSNDQAATRYLRLRTYLLGKSAPAAPGRVHTGARCTPVVRVGQPIVGSREPRSIQRDVESLPENHCLAQSGDYRVLLARATQIPETLQEIGRLREITFRQSGEGTGKCTDIDWFDNYYLHLFLWDQTKRRVAGAYRLGQTDRTLLRYGKKGLYSYTLLRYGSSFLRRVDPAIELGRSFVCREYQRSYSALMLLWKGIGAFIVRSPQYNILFGPVSISSAYNSYSQQLLVDFLRGNRYLDDYARLVRPRRPYRDMRHVDGWRGRGIPENPGRRVGIGIIHGIRLQGHSCSLEAIPKAGGSTAGLQRGQHFQRCP